MGKGEEGDDKKIGKGRRGEKKREEIRKERREDERKEKRGVGERRGCHYVTLLLDSLFRTLFGAREGGAHYIPSCCCSVYFIFSLSPFSPISLSFHSDFLHLFPHFSFSHFILAFSTFPPYFSFFHFILAFLPLVLLSPFHFLPAFASLCFTTCCASHCFLFSLSRPFPYQGNNIVLSSSSLILSSLFPLIPLSSSLTFSSLFPFIPLSSHIFSYLFPFN